MNTALFFIRLVIVALWLLAAGLVFSTYQHWQAFSQASWLTLLFCEVAAAAYFTTIALATKFLWNPK